MKKLAEKPNRIAELRQKHSLSQEKLAEILNVAQSTISAYENGANIPIDILIAISDLFGVTVDYILRTNYDFSDIENKIIWLYRGLSAKQRALIVEFVKLLD